ncbi:protein LONGIFOLIA 1-like [Lotus japonicus]|uniref:protein LONGIFOLIA 1-like n=1 Tax=Lotus japonicus TaxID=34305 RepID=UPI002590F883|nr:protein LONGIFOLIA 1-like [Lotus japonicus]
MTTLVGDNNQNLEKHIHKQMGCMAGFLQIFDRHQILSPKRIYSTKRLPPPPTPPDSSPEALQHGVSPAREAQPEPKVVVVTKANPPPPALPVLEFKEGTRSSWKFSREAPRLSLDSRAVVDAKGSLHPRTDTTAAAVEDKQRRSTSVIARLMGLGPIPDSDPEPGAKLRRSASESRVPRDLPLPLPPQCRFFESKANSFHHQESNVVNANCNGNGNGCAGTENHRLGVSPARASAPVRQRGGTTMTQKKSFYDSTDFFPEPKDMDAIYGVIERRLRMRGINQPSQDLHTLKNILEALQLKGLLHSEKPNQSPIVVMKPGRSSSGSANHYRTGYESPPPHSSFRSSSPRARTPSPSESDRNVSARNQSRVRNTSPNRRKVQNVETTRRKVSNDGGSDSRRVSPVNSPKISTRKNPANQGVTCGSSPRLRKPIDSPKMKVLGLAEDESSTVSENSFSTSSHTDTERYKMEEYREGKNLLDRCDKLLNSIAEITAANELQPSPVSVLDSSFYKDEWCSPSPIPKRCIDYKDQALDSEDDMWSSALCSSEDAAAAEEEDSDLVYVSEILRASSYLPEESDVFVLLEKRKGKDTSRASKLQRRLIFDTLQEILNRNQKLPPWKAAARGEETVWSEFRRIRDREESASEDMFGVICGVLRKDMAAEMSGWGEWTVEMGDVVLDIERLVFKDLIGETIQQLASFGPQCNNSNKVSALRRKLVF